VDGPRALDALVRQLPPGAVSTHPGELAERAGDRRAVALLRELRGERVPPPAALVFPSSTEEVAAVLAWASQTATPVVTRGGGSGLAGGAEALMRSIVLDTSRLDRILDVDDVSQAVRAEAGVRGDVLERELNGRGFTAGHEPASLAASTVGGWVATGAIGHTSAGQGSIEDRVLGLTAVLAGGAILRLKPAPRSGVGPDLRRLVAGSEGTLAVITDVTLAASRLPRALAWAVFRPHAFDTGVALVRELIQRGFRPLIARLLDGSAVAETFSAFGLQGPLALIGFDAGAPAADVRRFEAERVARELGARPGDRQLAEHWWDHRFDAMARAESVMGPERALGEGVVADSLDTAALWRHLPSLYERVRGELLDGAESVACRLVHPREAGACLQFSFVIRGTDDRAAERRYAEAWSAAVAAALDAGGALAHHQGIGLRSVASVPEDLGRTGAEVLRLLRTALDPGGVLNPGKLVGGEPA
jgi:alkyldihydroxyacetonephosphate synthase